MTLLISHKIIKVNQRSLYIITTMKKTKSASLLKIPSLAASSKKSVQFDTQTINHRLTLARSSANLTVGSGIATIKPTKLLYPT